MRCSSRPGAGRSLRRRGRKYPPLRRWRRGTWTRRASGARSARPRGWPTSSCTRRTGSGAMTERLIATLASWPDRYGAELVAHWGTMLHFVVTRPPNTLEDASNFALEHDLVAPGTNAARPLEHLPSLSATAVTSDADDFDTDHRFEVSVLRVDRDSASHRRGADERIENAWSATAAGRRRRSRRTRAPRRRRAVGHQAPLPC